MTAKVATCLWFNDQAEEAANLYVSLIADSQIKTVFRPVPNGPVLIVEFTLGGAPYQALNGGPMYAFTEAASISVRTKDQAETDRLWDRSGSPAALTLRSQPGCGEPGHASHAGYAQNRYQAA
jgi:predicted 3-demethylubiquinone-9 3-methyltransferase (glyoxalase superfamily)